VVQCFPSSEKAAVSVPGVWGARSLSSCANWDMPLHLAIFSHVNIFLLCKTRGWTKCVPGMLFTLTVCDSSMSGVKSKTNPSKHSSFPGSPQCVIGCALRADLLKSNRWDLARMFP
jgi:hypothetical protein